MLKAIADRFAEAFAEYLHKEIRINYWGYTKEENLSNEDLIEENIEVFVLHQDILLVLTI